VLYKELDRAYPGSKFILTVRDEVDWLRSVRDHFSWRNPFRWEWKTYPFTNQIHRNNLRPHDFDSLTFLERYRRHNAEVIDYFKNRPDDLLGDARTHMVISMRLPEKPVPAVEYRGSS